MLEIYFTENSDIYGKLKSHLSRLLPSSFEILRTENGKPYLEGSPLFFSISHSDDKALIVFCDKPVGADLEVIQKRKYSSILSRFSAEEKKEISDTEDFLSHWTVREAYIKMLGSTINYNLDKLSYINGVLYDGNDKAECEIINGVNDGCIYCICIGK